MAPTCGFRFTFQPVGQRRGWPCIVLEALQLSALGIAIGALGAWLATRALASLVFEVRAGDPLTLVTVAGVLTAATLIAAGGPARRAGRVDPISAIRAK